MINPTGKTTAFIVLTAFILISMKSPVLGEIDAMPRMPLPGMMLHLSPVYTPAYLKGITLDPKDPLKLNFIVYRGNTPLILDQKKREYNKLIKYFLASLAIPDDDQWVNLSPYEKDWIIKNDFGKTEMGRDLLAEDYILKQVTASLIYPENDLGRKFWDKVYAQTQQQFGTSNIPMNTFNKVWIVPDDAWVYEKANSAYVLSFHLKVMLEEDYLSLKKHSGISSSTSPNSSVGDSSKVHAIASQIVRQIMIPALEKEVNEGQNFATLRQVFSGVILAAWFKRALKQSLLGVMYANKAKVKGVDQDPRTNEEIYQYYLSSYKKGVFNYIKEDVNRHTNESIPRKYFSGGMEAGHYDKYYRKASADQAQIAELADAGQEDNVSAAMTTPSEDQPRMELDDGSKILVSTVLEVARWMAITLDSQTGRISKIDDSTLKLRLNIIRVAGFFLDGKLQIKYGRRGRIEEFSPRFKGSDLGRYQDAITDLLHFEKRLPADDLKNARRMLVETGPIRTIFKPDSKGKVWIDLPPDTTTELEMGIALMTVRQFTGEYDLRTNFHGKIYEATTDFLRGDEPGYVTIKPVGNLDNAAMTVWTGLPAEHPIDKKNQTKNEDPARKTPGGIDMNAGNWALTIKSGRNGMPLSVSKQDMAQLAEIDGIVPVILSITPEVLVISNPGAHLSKFNL